MGILSENSIVGASFVAPEHYPYKIDNSLKFNDDDSAYLSWTPAAAGNRKTWTWSGWVKRGNISSRQIIFASSPDGNTEAWLAFESNNKLWWKDFVTSSYNYDLITNRLFRDAGAWYHIMIVNDTTQGTTANRIKLYVNGVQETSFAAENYPSQNFDGRINNNVEHTIGRASSAYPNYNDGTLAEVNFIDGQAKTPSDFGEADADYGDWKPKAYTGTHGTNGFYLPFKQDYTVEGFSAVTYTGDSTLSHLIQGVGYQPDVVWLKTRTNQADSHALFDAVRGGGYHLRTDSTLQHLAGSFSYDTDGFTLGNNDGQTNSSSNTYIAWTWDMGGTTVSNTNGSVTSSVRANSAYGQSIVKYTGVGGSSPTSNTIGHGLAAAPEMIILKKYTQADDWQVYHKDLDTYTLSKLILNTTASTVNDGSGSSFGSPRNIGSSTFTIGYNGAVSATGADHIAYCFHSVAGYSKIGSYTGGGNIPVTITTGFRPAFVMVKNTDTASNWEIFDSSRNTTNPRDLKLGANLTALENGSDLGTTSQNNLDFLSSGFKTLNNSTDTNESGSTFIYMAFADTKEYSFFTDKSTNSNHWTPNNLSSVADVMLDTPTNNFCTLNPLEPISSAINFSEGNLKHYQPAHANFNTSVASMEMPKSGKWYAEARLDGGSVHGSAGNYYGWSLTGDYITSGFGNTGSTVGIYESGANQDSTLRINSSNYNTGNSPGSAGTAGDIIQWAYDSDTGKCWLGKNGVWYGNNTGHLTTTNSPNPVTGTFPVDTFTASQMQAGVMMMLGMSDQLKSNGWVVNFGQDSSFAGNKTAQGNQDSNSIGDFYYAPPTGFLALCSANLPDPTVIPSEHFNTVLWTGNGTTGTGITGVGFQPDFTWLKGRDIGSDPHQLYDAIRGATESLKSNATDAEITRSTGLTAFGSDGFTIGNHAYVNRNTSVYVAWNWKAGGAAVSNTNGTITSSVSANVDAGFSIVSYTGTGSAGNVGHGLSVAPEFVVVKKRNSAGTSWVTLSMHAASSSPEDYYAKLDETDNFTDHATIEFWGNTAPTANVFYLGDHTWNNASSDTYIAYLFHSVDGYSKVGSYTGNGSTDGTFVHTGFRPAYVLIKRSSASEGWYVKDIGRDSNGNPVHNSLSPHDSSAEFSTHSSTHSSCVDFLSNGFKLRGNDTQSNDSGSTFIFLAFAEMPSKWTNAR